MSIEVDPRYQEITNKWRTRPAEIPKPQALVYRLLVRILYCLLVVYFPLNEFGKTVLRILTVTQKRIWTTVTGRMRLPQDYILRRFTRIPSHMVLAVEPNTRAESGLFNVDKALAAAADLVAWCSIIGIPYVTLYDHEGILKSHANEVQQLIDDHMSHIKKVHRFRIRKVIKMVDGEWTKNNNFLPREPATKDIVHVRLVSWRDGKEDLAAGCRRLAERGIDLKKGITIADFEEQLQANHGFPCPDVMILWGETKSPLGFLPWHIHLTEIIRLPQYIQMGYDTVHMVLSRFDKCEVRLGT